MARATGNSVSAELKNGRGFPGRFAAAHQKPSKTFPQTSDEVEAVQVHHLGPRRHEVFHKLLLRVRARIDFREGAHLRVRTEDQVDAGAGPLDLVRRAVASF